MIKDIFDVQFTLDEKSKSDRRIVVEANGIFDSIEKAKNNLIGLGYPKEYLIVKSVYNNKKKLWSYQ